MRRQILLWFSLSLSTMVISSKCAPNPARSFDLLPIQKAAAFCNTDKARKKLIVTVKNQGTVDSPPTSTRVEFSRKQMFAGATVVNPTPSVTAGQSVDVEFDIPSGCFEPDCGFKITVNSNNANETNTENNSATGNCVG
jgi:hypothetical protein